MRKSRIIYLLVTGMVLFGLAGGAWAYQFNDNTLVQYWSQGAVYDGWVDVIGASYFDTKGADLNGNILTITTNWNPNRDFSLNGALVKTADLFIQNSSGLYAIRLDQLTGTGNLFTIGTYSTSDDIFKAVSGVEYGGRYDQAAPKAVPTWALTNVTGTRSVVWNISANGVDNTVAVDLTGLDGAGWAFLWGTGTCANDVITGSTAVPEPAIMLLLGIGLVGLAGLRWKFKN